MHGTLEISDSEIYKIKIVKWKLEVFYFGDEGTSPQFTFDGKGYYIGIRRVNVNYGGTNSTDEVYLSAVDNKMGGNFEYVIECKKPSGSVMTVKNRPLSFNRREFQGYQTRDYYNQRAVNLTFICAFHHGNNTICDNVNLKEISSQTDVVECIEQLSQNMKELLISSRHVDVTIKVGNKVFKAHKSILAARSPVLDSMFSHQMLEKETGILNISDIDESAFEDFLMFLYTGKIDEIAICKVTGLYKIADKYEMMELKIECVKRLMIEMSVDLVCDSLRLATVFDEKLLMETAIKYFTENVEEVLDTETWESFCKDHFKLGNELLKKCFRERPK